MHTIQRTIKSFGKACAGAVALLVVCAPLTAHGFFGDPEQTNANTLSASSLGISLSVSSEDADSREIAISGDGAESLEYRLTKQSASGDLCDDVRVHIKHESVTIHNGSLDTFAAGTSTPLASGGMDDWTFDFDNLDHSGSCAIAFAYEANQPSYTHGKAFFDTEIDLVTLTGTGASVPDVVLNEILPNPTGDDSTDGAAGEWVELYNNTGSTIDLDGWYIKDADGWIREIGALGGGASTTPNGETEIGPYNWLVVYLNSAMLHNDGDTVYLYNASDELQDSYSYGDHASGVDSTPDPDGNPTRGSTNGNTTTNGNTQSGTAGKSDARIPDGIGNWVDPEPTPGEPNVVTAEELRELGLGETKIAIIMARQEEAARARQEAEERAGAEGEVMEPESADQQPDAAPAPEDEADGSDPDDEGTNVEEPGAPKDEDETDADETEDTDDSDDGEGGDVDAEETAADAEAGEENPSDTLPEESTEAEDENAPEGEQKEPADEEVTEEGEETDKPAEGESGEEAPEEEKEGKEAAEEDAPEVEVEKEAEPEVEEEETEEETEPEEPVEEEAPETAPEPEAAPETEPAV